MRERKEQGATKSINLTNLNPRPNPHVGPRAFQTGEKLYGGDHEVRELLDLFIAERIVLLHSLSGAGKSSLVQAGLVPALEEEGFEVLPPVRVNQELPSSLPRDERELQNRYPVSVLLSLKEDTLGDTPLEELASLSLDDYLEQLPYPNDQDQSGEGKSQVFIFDQFEEVLTVDATDNEAKLAFLEQLGDTLRRRHRWALFVMREDYMDALDPYLRPHPTRPGVTYRLDNLGVKAGQQTFQQPVVESWVDFLPGVVNKLLDDLREVQVQRSDGIMEVRPGPYIEPVQLQVVCFHLCDQLPADKMEISEDDLSAIGNVDQSLADYNAQQVAMIAKNADVKERRIRDWFEHQLITEGGIRGQERKKPEEKSKLENHAIKMLEDAHLVRAEKRMGATWFELAHHRLIQPVRVNNDTWFLENLSLLQRQASLWEQENRSDTLYLRDEALAEAEVWAADNPQEVSPTDQAFLDAFLAVRVREGEARLAVERERQMKLETAQKVAEAERLRAEEQAQAASTQAFENANIAKANEKKAVEKEAEAEEQSTFAQSSRLALQSMALLKTQHDMAALMSVGAFRTAETWEAKKALLNSIPTDQQPIIAYGHPIPTQANSVDSVAFSPDKRQITWGRADGEIVIWDYRDNVESQRYQFHQYRGKSLAFSPKDGALLVSGGEFDGQIVLWDVVNKTELANYLPETNIGGVRSLSFHPNFPDTPYIAVAIGSQVIFLEDKQEDGETNLEQIKFGTPDIKGAVYNVEWSPDGEWLATASADTIVYVWNPLGGEIPSNHTFDNHQAFVRSIAWYPDSTLLASADEGGKIYLWKRDSKTLEVSEPMEAYTQIYSLDFSTDGKYLASGGQDNKIELWDIDGKKADETTPHSWMIVDLDFSPIEGEYLLASASYDRSIGLHEILKPQPLNSLKATFPGGPLTSLAIDNDETLWQANVGEDINSVQVQYYSIQDSKISTQPLVISISITPASVALSPDGTHISIAGFYGDEPSKENGSIGTYHLESGELVMSMSEDEEGNSMDGYIYSLAYSPDGSNLASSQCAHAPPAWDGEQQCEDNSIWIWEITTGGLDRKIPTGHTDFIYALAFSPDCSLIASGSEDQSIRIKNLENTATEEMQLTGHTDRVISLAFSPDGATLASGGMDKILLLWDIATHQPIGELVGEYPEGRQGSITSLIYAPNGESLYSGDSQGALYAWDVNFKSWLERACDRSRPKLTDAEWALYFPALEPPNTEQGNRTACEILLEELTSLGAQAVSSTPTATSTPTPSPIP